MVLVGGIAAVGAVLGLLGSLASLDCSASMPAWSCFRCSDSCSASAAAC